MPTLLAQLESCFGQEACLLGLGNPEYGDDGFGVRFAEAAAKAGVPRVTVAGTTPERSMRPLLEQGCPRLILADAVDFGGDPGAVVFLGASEIIARFPQISTHRLSLGILARWAEATGRTNVWLLGVQPASLARGSELTPVVQNSLNMLTRLLARVARSSAPV